VPFHDIGDEGGQQNEDQLLELLAEYDVDLIVLARYMRILSPNVVFRYEDRIINVHPRYCRRSPARKPTGRQAVEEGVRVAGVTGHYVTTDLDQGPIITQRAFDVPDDADLEEMKRRGQPLEADALLEAVQLHLNGDVSVHRTANVFGPPAANVGSRRTAPTTSSVSPRRSRISRRRPAGRRDR